MKNRRLSRLVELDLLAQLGDQGSDPRHSSRRSRCLCRACRFQRLLLQLPDRPRRRVRDRVRQLPLHLRLPLDP